MRVFTISKDRFLYGHIACKAGKIVQTFYKATELMCCTKVKKIHSHIPKGGLDYIKCDVEIFEITSMLHKITSVLSSPETSGNGQLN